MLIGPKSKRLATIISNTFKNKIFKMYDYFVYFLIITAFHSLIERRQK